MLRTMQGYWLARILLGVGVCVMTSGAIAVSPPTAERPWRALHIFVNSNAKLQKLTGQLPELAKLGINCVIAQVDYAYEFESHPELRFGKEPITKAEAQRFAAECRRNGIEPVPQFSCLGHQSWGEQTVGILAKYPELDLTPGAFPGNKGIYCREWDPMNPKTNELAFALIDELIDAFDAKAFHVGLDEVFLIVSDKAPSTRGLDPADVFAKVVNDLHAHIVGQRKVTMVMWADRLIDAKKVNLGEWESSKIGTAGALDKIPKDIVLCPWHYETRKAYESLPLFAEKGFPVLAASWKDTAATLALIRDEKRNAASGRIVGHMFTTWSERDGDWEEFEPMVKGLELLKAGGD